MSRGASRTPASVSACVIARDDEERIRGCLESLRWVDECIVVVDDRSRDATEAIAREFGARVDVRRYEGNIEQKNFALGLAKCDWVLAIDADEVLSSELVRNLRERLATPGSVAGYELCRLTYHLGRWIRHGDFYPDWTLRLFRKAKAKWVGQNPHGRIEVSGTVIRLAGELEHYSYRDLADQVERIQRFSDAGAMAMDAGGSRFRLRDLLLRPPARFARAYVLKQGFRDGLPGFIVAVATAFHVFLKYAKLWERNRGV